jgi:hypothetical protein
MKSPLWRALALIAMSILIPLLMLEDAQAARRSGLAGNLQITDPDDVFIFPHHNIRYRDRMTIDMGGTDTYVAPAKGIFNSQTGSAHVIFGSESWALNLAASRHDFLTGVASGFWSGNDRGLFGLSFIVDPEGPSGLDPFELNWIDVGFAKALASSELGLRVGVGRAAETTTTTPAGGTGLEVDDFARIIHFQASWGNETLDVGAEFATGTSGSSVSGDPVAANNFDLEGSYTEFAIGLRKYWDWAGYEWTVIGGFASQSGDTDILTGPGTTAQDEQSATAWQVGFGPCWRNAPETWQVAAQIWVGGESGTDNPNGDGEDKGSSLTVPGFTGSMEYVHGRWAIRGGARSYYNQETFEQEDSTGTFEENDRSYFFTWTAGASVAIGDNFLIDMAFNEAKVLDGPAAIGAQNGTPLFAIVSATLNWGGTGE